MQEHVYNHETKEAVVNVPAHKNYGNNSYIMLGRTSNHPLAGKMMTVEGGNCELHDIFPDVHPEELSKGFSPNLAYRIKF